MPNAYLVYNPNSGRYPSWLLTERAADVLKRQGWQLTIEQSQSGEHITRLARQASESGQDAFFIVGGDGSVNLAASGLVGSNTALGVLPAGTANVWGQELGLPGLTWTRWLALEESARQLAQGEMHWVDIGLCNGRPFLLWSGIGLDAFIVHRIEPRQPWEKQLAVVQYAASAVWNASLWQGMQLRVQVQGEEISGHFLLAVVSNIHLYVGGYAQISPAAQLDDGLMDLWLFRGETLIDIIQRMWDLFSGRHLQSDQVYQYSFQSCQLESDSEMYVQIDGEPADSRQPVFIEVKPHALKVLVPMNTPRSLFSE